METERFFTSQIAGPSKDGGGMGRDRERVGEGEGERLPPKVKSY